MLKKSKLLCVVAGILLFALFFAYRSNLIGPKRHNAIVIMIDTLRADHLGSYGYSRDTSPTLDAFANENVRAARAIAVAPWTPPSVASILTGLSVARHGYSPDRMESTARRRGEVLREDLDTLPEILKKSGYQTAGVSASPWISAQFNFTQGFDSFFYARRTSTEEILSASKSEIKKFSDNKAKPFFLYIHILDPHGPRTPKGKYANMFTGSVEGRWPYDAEMQNDVNLYDNEIRSVDDQLGEFFSDLKAKNIYDNTAIVVVSDHGEQFREHGGTGHGKMLHIEEVHVPLLVKCKGKKAVVEPVVSNMDVTPTVLDCLNIESNNKFDGVSILDDKKVEERTGTFSSVKRAFIQEAFTTKEGMRIINSKGDVKNPTKDWEVKGTFNLDKDPLEANPVFDANLISELRGYLESAKAMLSPKKVVENPSKVVSDESMEQLESLGYINE